MIAAAYRAYPKKLKQFSILKERMTLTSKMFTIIRRDPRILWALWKLKD